MSQAMDRVIHVRFDGRSEELTAATLSLSDVSRDEELKQAVARHFDLPRHSFDTHVVVRTRNAIIIRPEAIYG